MNIVFVASEFAPWAKVGGLADVAAGLPAALHRRKENVSVVLPFYRSIDTNRVRAQDTGIRLSVWMDGSFREGHVWMSRHQGVPVYLIGQDQYYGRDGLYGEGGLDYPDNAFRFAFFARATLEAAARLGLEPDLFHINDWQTALLPVYRTLFYRGNGAFARAAVVLSIHNLAYQGIFNADLLSPLGLPWDVFHIDGMEFYGSLNFLKAGLNASDLLTTVSPTYAREIQTVELGAGLDGLLRRRAGDLVGILNGIDTQVWDPSKDEALSAPYGLAQREGKSANKAELQRKLGLAVSVRTPLFGCIARLDFQKGLDILLEVAPNLIREGAQIVLLGSGREDYVSGFRKLHRRFPTRFSLNEGFQAELASQIYAGADLFVMPSRYEPCGLGQMIALRYGTIPVVRRTGGLADTIIDVDEDPDHGNGFVFDRFEGRALLDAARRAMNRFGKSDAWQNLVERAMRADFSWRSSALHYQEVYRRAVRKARGEAA